MIKFFQKLISNKITKEKVKKSFPNFLEKDVEIVLKAIKKKTINNIIPAISTEIINVKLLSGESIELFYRIYYNDDIEIQLTKTQELIYHAIFSRSYDGYIREKHLKKILEMQYDDWCIPFIVKLCDEYVIEILQLVYDELKDKDTIKLQEFCKLNQKYFLYAHSRMVNYWNEYYRYDIYRYNKYIGKKLFSECFGYKKSMEKLRKRNEGNS